MMKPNRFKVDRWMLQICYRDDLVKKDFYLHETKLLYIPHNIPKHQIAENKKNPKIKKYKLLRSNQYTFHCKYYNF